MFSLRYSFGMKMLPHERICLILVSNANMKIIIHKLWIYINDVKPLLFPTECNF